MPPRCPNLVGTTLTPFLYPSLFCSSPRIITSFINKQSLSSSSNQRNSPSSQISAYPSETSFSRLNPPPEDYSRNLFADRATVTIHAGDGGHGCISFLREKYIPYGPPNGGDGGYGGNIYIQAVRGETSLHKLSRRNMIRAGRGKNGAGKSQGGERGDDVIITVPVGTVIREVERIDPIAIEEEHMLAEAETARLQAKEQEESEKGSEEDPAEASMADMPHWSRKKLLLYPAMTARDLARTDLPRIPKARRSHLSAAQAKAPINLDLSKPMDRPILLAAGAVGGLGNPHFVTRSLPRPKFATRGSEGLKITIDLELKLLADVGLVGLPNAGKSTLLRAISNSRTRIGNWAFTTLEPNIGTVVLDDHHGRPRTVSSLENGDPRTHFTIADIPGLVEDAHLDRGLGISFLRHVERARVLAFVIDLSTSDAVTTLLALWKEVGEYERLKNKEELENRVLDVEWSPFRSPEDAAANRSETIVMPASPVSNGTGSASLGALTSSIAGKPWFVVATKADLPDTQENFARLKDYLTSVAQGQELHPSGQKHGWVRNLESIPISAINGHGMDRIVSWTVGLLDQ